MNKTNEEIKKDKNGKPIKGATKVPEPKKPKKGEVDSSPIGVIMEEIKLTETKINTIGTNLKVMNDKQYKLVEYIEKFKLIGILNIT